MSVSKVPFSIFLIIIYSVLLFGYHALAQGIENQGGKAEIQLASDLDEYVILSYSVDGKKFEKINADRIHQEKITPGRYLFLLYQSESEITTQYEFDLKEGHRYMVSSELQMKEINLQTNESKSILGEFINCFKKPFVYEGDPNKEKDDEGNSSDSETYFTGADMGDDSEEVTEEGSTANTEQYFESSDIGKINLSTKLPEGSEIWIRKALNDSWEKYTLEDLKAFNSRIYPAGKTWMVEIHNINRKTYKEKVKITGGQIHKIEVAPDKMMPLIQGTIKFEGLEEGDIVIIDSKKMEKWNKKYPVDSGKKNIKITNSMGKYRDFITTVNVLPKDITTVEIRREETAGQLKFSNTPFNETTIKLVGMPNDEFKIKENTILTLPPREYSVLTISNKLYDFTLPINFKIIDGQTTHMFTEGTYKRKKGKLIFPELKQDTEIIIEGSRESVAGTVELDTGLYMIEITHPEYEYYKEAYEVRENESIYVKVPNLAKGSLILNYWEAGTTLFIDDIEYSGNLGLGKIIKKNVGNYSIQVSHPNYRDAIKYEVLFEKGTIFYLEKEHWGTRRTGKIDFSKVVKRSSYSLNYSLNSVSGTVDDKVKTGGLVEETGTYKMVIKHDDYEDIIETICLPEEGFKIPEQIKKKGQIIVDFWEEGTSLEIDKKKYTNLKKGEIIKDVDIGIHDFFIEHSNYIQGNNSKPWKLEVLNPAKGNLKLVKKYWGERKKGFLIIKNYMEGTKINLTPSIRFKITDADGKAGFEIPTGSYKISGTSNTYESEIENIEIKHKDKIPVELTWKRISSDILLKSDLKPNAIKFGIHSKPSDFYGIKPGNIKIQDDGLVIAPYQLPINKDKMIYFIKFSEGNEFKKGNKQRFIITALVQDKQKEVLCNFKTLNKSFLVINESDTPMEIEILDSEDRSLFKSTISKEFPLKKEDFITGMHKIIISGLKYEFRYPDISFLDLTHFNSREFNSTNPNEWAKACFKYTDDYEENPEIYHRQKDKYEKIIEYLEDADTILRVFYIENSDTRENILFRLTDILYDRAKYLFEEDKNNNRKEIEQLLVDIGNILKANGSMLENKDFNRARKLKFEYELLDEEL